MMDMIREDLAALDIHHDVFFSERSPAGRRRGTRSPRPSTSCAARDLVYMGRLPPPKGQKDEDWEDREQLLFRATAFGDEVDRPLLKSDGSYTYFASDIAYHRSKFERGFAEMIDVWGADHGGYVKRMQAAVKAVTDRQGDLDVKLCQLVKLLRGGEPVKMSKRSGDFVTLREVVDEVGPRRRALHDAVSQERRDPRFRPRQGGRAVEGQPGLLRAIRPCPLRIRAAAGRRGVPQADFSGRSLAAADLSVLADEAEMDVIRRSPNIRE